MKKELTERQQEILSFIQGYQKTHGYPPTYREIGKKFDIASTFGVKRHLDALVKKGYINIESNASRALSILDSSNGIDTPQENYTAIPVVGRVAAGYPIFAEENIEDSILVDQIFTRKKEGCFALKVKGDSMMDAGILEGDTVVIMPQKQANHGDIVVALLEEESTLKRFVKIENKYYLKPENRSYPLIEINDPDNFSIVGKVVGVLRSYN